MKFFGCCTISRTFGFYNILINRQKALKGVLSMSVLQTIDLKKYYGTEPDITRAFDCVNFSVDEGEEQAKKNDEQLTIEDGRIVGVVSETH